MSFSKALIAVLVLGSLLHPASAVMGLFFILVSNLADKYLTSNISDKDRQDISGIKAELAKVKQSQQSQDLAKAFGPRNG